MAPRKEICYVFFLFFVSSWAAMPHGWQACKYGAPTHKECLMKQVNLGIKSLKDGSKPLGVNSIDPLKLLTLKIEQGSGPVSINLDFKDCDVTGLSSCYLLSLENKDWKNLSGKGRCKSSLELNGNYKIDGKILTLPIKGEGKAMIRFDDTDVDFEMKMKQVEKDGKKFVQVDDCHIGLKPKKVGFNLENLFNGNKELSDSTNKFLNENGDKILVELGPAITKGVSQAFTQITNRIFAKIPANEFILK